MKLLDYLYVFSFSGASALLTKQLLNHTLLAIVVGLIALIFCYKVTKDEYREGNE